jgi:formylmethanofuran dehydrogenase subunit B
MGGRYICSWCGKFLNDVTFEGDKHSYGICKACKKEVDKEFEVIKEYNDSVEGSKKIGRISRTK